LYQKIEVKIWNDKKFRELSGNAKYLFLYLLTSPHSNSIGLYVLPKGYILEDLNWDFERLGGPFGELLDKGFIGYDETVRVIFIKNQLRHRPLENPNQVAGALKVLKALPKTPLFSMLLERLDKPLYKPLGELLGEPLPEPITIAIDITKDITISSNPLSKALPSKKERPHDNNVTPSQEEPQQRKPQSKKRVSTEKLEPSTDSIAPRAIASG